MLNPIWKGSPNFTKNRAGRQLKYIIIHWFGGGTLESANSRFQNPDSKASAHYGISKGRLWQWVRDTDASWNAGVFSFTLQSIGIEHDAKPGFALSDQDYELSGQLVASLCHRYGLPLNRQTVIGHNQAKPTQCPGTINIDRIIAIAKKYLTPQQGEDHMVYFKVKGKPGIFELTNGSWRGYDDNESYKKDVAGKVVKTIELDQAEFDKLPQLNPI